MNFEAMFRAVNGFDPFPWQSNVASLLMANKADLSVNVPTAAGKTALIDAAVYAAAHGGPRRIAFIIDRRVVVDEAYLKAKRIADSLQKPLMSALADKLGEVQIVRLRGGVHGDDDWVLYPERVTIILSTVDQIGSRLLHRGYGVSARMAPLHAGFVGNDCIYIVDEAHLSSPFVETVNSTRTHGADIRLVTMTATPVSGGGDVAVLSGQDRSHPVLSKRLQASKKAKLLDVPNAENDFVNAAADAAEKLTVSGQVIGVVVNRVATARRIWKKIAKQKIRTELLTGRIRPYDRDVLMERLLPEIRTGRRRKPGQPLVVVATQTIEVGADIDFDGLVTEAAPLDALRQRFGRLARSGELRSTQAVIICREPQLDKDNKPIPDPVYGTAIYYTWRWLQDLSQDGFVDFGITAMEESMKRSAPPATKAKPAPALLPSHISLLSQTGPQSPFIDVSPWLHGAGSASSDISLIWRADLLPENPAQWEVVRLRPPLTREALEIPVYAARSWLQGQQMKDVSDIEGVPSVEVADKRSDKPVLRWRGPDDFKEIQPRMIRAGDTIVIPAAYGGCDDYGWDPGVKEPVRDIADFCSLERRRDLVVRLVPGLTGWLKDDESAVQEAVAEIVAAETQVDPEMGVDQERINTAHDALRALLKEVDHPLVKAFRHRFEIELHPSGVVLRGRVFDDVDGTLSGGVAVPLVQHLDGVAQKADLFSVGHAGRDAIKRAAKIHDLGKKETRFQVMLHGDPFTAAAGLVLAKSGLRRFAEKNAARAQSGLPRGFRHELASLEFSAETDPLACHLVGTHHGYGRPWFPVCYDLDAPGVARSRLDSGWLNAFASLLKRYNPWFLAGMELIVRAADARQSIEEQEAANG